MAASAEKGMKMKNVAKVANGIASARKEAGNGISENHRKIMQRMGARRAMA